MGQMSRDNPLAPNLRMHYNENKTSASRGNVTGKHMHGSQRNYEQQAQDEKYKQEVQQVLRPVHTSQGSVKPKFNIEGPQKVPKFQTILVDRFRQKLKSRGGRSIQGLQRQFKIFDDDGSGDLDEYEFTKAINDFGVEMEDKDIDTLFKTFDYDKTGRVNFNEFIRVVVGPMN